MSGAESRRDTAEPHAPTTANPDNHQAFTVCFAVDHVEGADFTIDKPRGYGDFWKGYEPKLNPRWPGNLLSWRCPTRRR